MFFIDNDFEIIMNARVGQTILKEDLCESIMNLSENTLAVVLLDENGRTKNMKIREDGVFSSLSPARRDAMFNDAAFRQMMRKEFDKDVGKEEYTLTKRVKIIFISFPINDSLLIVVTQPFIDTYHICKKILKALSQN